MAVRGGCSTADLDDPAAANYFVTVVEDGGLAGGYGALGVVEGGEDFLFQWSRIPGPQMRGTGGTLGRRDKGFEGGPGGVVAVADLDFYAHGGGEGGDADPVEAAGAESLGGEFGVGAYRDLVRVRVDGEDVERRGGADAEALALADGEVGDAVVMSDDFAVGSDEFAGGVRDGAALLFEVGSEELLVVAAGDEADFLGVGLFSEGQAGIASGDADVWLFHGAEGEEGAGELVLSEAEEEVGLVLGQVGGALEDPAGACGVVLVDGVVAGGDAVRADGAGGEQELVKLEVVVAEGTGDGGAAVEVLVNEGADYVLLETLLLVDDVVGDAEMLGDATGVVDIVQAAAAAGFWSVRNAVLAGEAGLVPELEGEADYGFAGLGEHGCDGGGVYSSGHGDGDGGLLGHGLASQQVRLACNWWLWLPTHRAKDARWMGHLDSYASNKRPELA